MEHIVCREKEQLHESAAWNLYFANRRVCVLDIETTGLDRSRCRFILGGLYDPVTGELHQVFAEGPGEEKEALAEFMKLVQSYDVAVTYNGRHFDMPFLEERIRHTGLGAETGWSGYDGYDLDLYQVVNGHSPLRRLLPNLRQKTVEDYLGLWSDRSDEISGAESVELYGHYVRTKDAEARKKILLHNSDDVLQLTRLGRVIDKCDFHRAMYHMGFPAGPPRRRWQIRQIRSVRNILCAEGLQGAERIDYRSYALGNLPMQAAFDARSGTFRLEIPILRRSGIAAADLRAAGIGEEAFQKYPGYGSGFLVVEERNEIKYREVDHLITAIVRMLCESMEGTVPKGE